MNASLKLVLGRQIRGIRQIESKISDLQAKQQHLLKQRQQDIAKLISAVDLIHIDDPTLVGGLIFVKNKIATHNSVADEWHNVGAQFLRRTKKPKRLDSPKRAATSPSTHQSPQKQAQSKDKPDEKATTNRS